MMLKIHNDQWEKSVELAKQFIVDFPYRIGIRNGVAYSNPKWARSFYVYRTKTGMVVVR